MDQINALRELLGRKGNGMDHKASHMLLDDYAEVVRELDDARERITKLEDDLKCTPSWEAFDALNLRAQVLGDLLKVVGPMFKDAEETIALRPLPKEQNWTERP